jgi:nicotinamide-nucleotide amidase
MSMGRDDAELAQLAEEVARRLGERGETVAVAESSTGGLISAALLGVAGASGYFKGGVVVYNSAAKERLAGMTQEELAAHRSATRPHAELLAGAIRRRLDADWAIAEAGAAGPTGNRYGDPAGHVALAVAGPAQGTQVTETPSSSSRPGMRTLEIKTGSTDRRANMETFAVRALQLLIAALDEKKIA